MQQKWQLQCRHDKRMTGWAARTPALRSTYRYTHLVCSNKNYVGFFATTFNLLYKELHILVTRFLGPSSLISALGDCEEVKVHRAPRAFLGDTQTRAEIRSHGSPFVSSFLRLAHPQNLYWCQLLCNWNGKEKCYGDNLPRRNLKESLFFSYIKASRWERLVNAEKMGITRLSSYQWLACLFPSLHCEQAEIPIGDITADLSAMKKLHLKHNYIYSPLLLFPHIYSILRNLLFVIYVAFNSWDLSNISANFCNS